MKKTLIILLVLVAALIIGQQKGLIVLPIDKVQNQTAAKKKNDVKAVVKQPIQLNSYEDTITSVIQKSLPSVVTIKVSKTTQSPSSIIFDPFDSSSPFKKVPGKTQEIEGNIGSGFAISKDGYIVTNKHVVADGEAQYKVITNDGKQHDVLKISRDPLNDLAIVKIEAHDLKTLSLADSENIKLGQTVIAIGTPLGQFTNTVTTGIISGLGRGIVANTDLEGSVERLDNVIQTDAAINPGNSGGPLISSDGLVIGVNTAISSSGQNIGFAIPSNVVSDLISNFDSSTSQIQRPFLGVRYQAITKQAAILNDVPQGVYVIDLIKGSPAEKSGILKGDIITEFNGTKISSETDTLQKLLSQSKVGSTVIVTIWRDGKTLSKSVKLEVFEQ